MSILNDCIKTVNLGNTDILILGDMFLIRTSGRLKRISCPLFYIIYGNALPEVLTNRNIALYVNDTILYTANNNFNDSVTKMQNDIRALAKWCDANGVSVNTK